MGGVCGIDYFKINLRNFDCFWFLRVRLPITVAALFKAWTVFTRSNAGIVGLNPTQSMDVCVCLFCGCVVRV
jgi:hypothetical protein